ncbi:hypothetical protein Q5X48_12715 [Acinetobacter baumannii]|nr:hypothetical protein [Acinetobacter baumannii]
MGLSKTQKIVFLLVMVILLLWVWSIFPVIFNWVMLGVNSKQTSLKDLGPLGDIYGSLNTLFTSATLLIVMYSAYLQRQANRHTRKAMEEQLKQAREATAEQLKHAKEATEEQLQQARESTKQQLDLAKSTHDAQYKETVYSNFLNTFNSLINYKLTKYNTIQGFVNGRIWHAEEIFAEIALYFLGQTEIFELHKTREQIGDLYFKALSKIAGTEKGFNEINSYFLLYESIFDLINNSEISEKEKIFFRKATSNTMSTHEQLTLLWAATYIVDCHELVKNTGIFSQFYRDDLMPFFVKFFEKSCFSHPDILSNWDKYKNSQNPA